MKNLFTPSLALYSMQSLSKGFSVFYFVLLPVFYAEKFINSTALGYLGGLFILFLIAGALFVAGWLHNTTTNKLLKLASVACIIATVILWIAVANKNVPQLIFAYCLMGLGVGTAMSGVKAIAGFLTTRGDRFSSLAKLHMLTDVVRIIFPILVTAMIAIGSTHTAIALILFVAFVFFGLSFAFPTISSSQEIDKSNFRVDILANKNFLYMLSFEFFDSFCSSQLFVFLPLLFLAKGYSLQNSLLLQSFIFLGYLAGRWFVSLLAKRFSGLKAIGYAEIGMVVAIFLLLTISNLWLLYFVSFILGVFARGTSPAIQALAFDILSSEQMKKGSALHVAAGDSGSAFGQFLFGLLVTWFGVTSPFIISAIVAALLGIIAFLKPIKIIQIEQNFL